jgi:PAS domain S-box-containing protein
VLAEIVSVAVIYYLTGRLGRLVAPPPGIATVVWPPSGIALAALLILGNRVWPGVWLGAFLSNNWGALHLGDARGSVAMLATGMGIDAGSLLQALAGAALVRRFIGARNPFDRVRDTLTFVGIALPMCLIASSCGVLSLSLGGFLPPDSALDRWSTWWVGDTGGVLVMTPVILTCWYQGWPRWNAARRREAAVLFSTVILFAMAIFLWWHPASRHKYPADLLILPLIGWVAVRFTQREVTLLVLLVLTIALAGTVKGKGPYAANDPWSMLPVLQAFIGILSMLSLSIAAAIAERKRTEEALQASEYWLKESQRISRVGSYVLDVQAGLWAPSEALGEIFGIEPGPARPVESWAELLHPDERQPMVDYFYNEVIGKKQPFDREYRIIGPHDGKIRWVHGRGELYYDAAGRLATMAGTIQDITEQKHLEAQLRQAHKMESIGRLAGGVAHDFNNLLTVINGYSDLTLSRMTWHDPLRKHVAAVRKAGERAAALTQQLLAFSRRQVLQPRVIDLNLVVADSESILRRLIEENIQFVTVLTPGLGMVSADPTQISQILLNLVVNARDAMPDGGCCAWRRPTSRWRRVIWRSRARSAPGRS